MKSRKCWKVIKTKILQQFINLVSFVPKHLDFYFFNFAFHSNLLTLFVLFSEPESNPAKIFTFHHWISHIWTFIHLFLHHSSCTGSYSDFERDFCVAGGKVKENGIVKKNEVNSAGDQTRPNAF